jgi:hypothetical protein
MITAAGALSTLVKTAAEDAATSPAISIPIGFADTFGGPAPVPSWRRSNTASTRIAAQICSRASPAGQ